MSFGEIKKAVNSNLGKPLDTLIEEKTGAVNATGGTATAGGIFAKLNKLLTDWTTARAGKIDNIDTNIGTLINGRVVKSVQRGSIAYNATSLDIPINAVNLSKSMISWAGQTSSGSSFYMARFELISSTVLRCVPVGSTTIVASWQVIEFY